jgi:hypothetical protein
MSYCSGYDHRLKGDTHKRWAYRLAIMRELPSFLGVLQLLGVYDM